jgi:hypothetical protein
VYIYIYIYIYGVLDGKEEAVTAHHIRDAVYEALESAEGGACGSYASASCAPLYHP